MTSQLELISQLVDELVIFCKITSFHPLLNRTQVGSIALLVVVVVMLSAIIKALIDLCVKLGCFGVLCGLLVVVLLLLAIAFHLAMI